jgi:hypothetical protein
MSGFQRQVNAAQAAAVVGDWASANPRQMYVAGPGGLVADSGGLVVGRFAWINSRLTDSNYAPKLASNVGWGKPAGIVHREQQALITDYLAESGLVIPAGFGTSLVTDGDLWVINAHASAVAVPGMKVYAEYGTGKMTFAATASPTTGTSTSFTIAAATGISVTGSITDNVLTVTAVGTGTVVPGAILTGSGVVTGTQVVAQLSGTPGGVGTYGVSIGGQSVASTTISGTYGVFTAGGTIAGAAFRVGMTLSGSDVTAGTVITALGTGTGGAGTYIVSPSQTASTGTITGAANIETKWRAVSGGNAGELVKIVSYAAV